MEELLGNNRTWEAYSWSFGLKGSSCKCQFLHTESFGSSISLLPQGLGWFVSGGLQSLCLVWVLLPSKAFAADGVGEQGGRALWGPVGNALASAESLVSEPLNGAHAGQTTCPIHSTCN